MRLVSGEGIGRADRRLAYAIAEGIGQRTQGAPAGTMTGNDMFDAERPQPFHRIGNNRLHYPTQMQTSHDAIDRNVREEVSRMRTDVDDARMRAGAEDNQPQLPHMSNEHALVHQERIRLPRSIGTGSTEVIDTSFFESA